MIQYVVYDVKYNVVYDVHNKVDDHIHDIVHNILDSVHHVDIRVHIVDLHDVVNTVDKHQHNVVVLNVVDIVINIVDTCVKDELKVVVDLSDIGFACRCCVHMVLEDGIDIVHRSRVHQSNPLQVPLQDIGLHLFSEHISRVLSSSDLANLHSVLFD